ncbi:MAG TPA: hypothetical protein PLA23_11925, partial [Methanospirillum sp.]|nr:hypothetical protein [Methanospirillum sp.]
MTSQIPDSIIWKTNKYEILGFENADDETGLFDPKKYGLTPSMMHTACYRGFYCTYIIEEDMLYLNTLCVNDKYGHYPPIHGIDAAPGRYDAFEYTGLHIHIPYTGVLRIGTDFKPEHYIHMGFQKPSAYGTVWDMRCVFGKVVEMKNISEDVQRIEGKYHDEYMHLDFVTKINDSFK